MTTALEFYRRVRGWRDASNHSDTPGSREATAAYSNALALFERTEVGAMCKLIDASENYITLLCLPDNALGKGRDIEKERDEACSAYEVAQGDLWST